MTAEVLRRDAAKALVRVQALVDSDGLRLLKRFAEAMRDSVRAGASCPTLPAMTDADWPLGTPINVPLLRASVHVPRSGIDKVKAYARMLRQSSRAGMKPPKFLVPSHVVESKTEQKQMSVSVAAQSGAVDTVRIREGMRAAREARNV